MTSKIEDLLMDEREQTQVCQRSCFWGLGRNSRSFLLLPLALFMACFSRGQSIQWEAHFGGSENEKANSVRQTQDGGYIVAGFSSSSDQDLNGNYGSVDRPDVWILKLDAQGKVSWTKRYGGTRSDKATSIRQTDDGGYIVACVSGSSDNDVDDHYGSFFGKDYWILKLDATGNIEWKNNYGGLANDYANAIRQVQDGNYVVAGYSSSDTRDVSTNYGSSDYWLLKLEAGTGQVLWERNYGGSSADQATAFKQTPNGGFIIAGHSFSSDSNVSNNYGNWDYWVLKTKADGTIEWENNLGGTRADIPTAIIRSADGNYVVGGLVQSRDKDVSTGFLGEDYWLAKIDERTGNILWEQTYGTDAMEQCWDLAKTQGQSLIAVGGESQYWPIKLDQSGQKLWDKRFGGSGDDDPFAIQQTKDGGYIMAGAAESTDGDVSGNNGKADIWVVKISRKQGCTPATATLDTTACKRFQAPSGDKTFAQDGTYKDTLENATVNGCDSIITINLTINEVDASADKSGQTLEANASGATYQWLDCDNSYAKVSGATSQSFTPSSDGRYAVEVTQNNCTDTSSCYKVETTGIAANSAKGSFEVYPNPAADQLTITHQSNLKPQNFELQTLTGKRLKTGQLSGTERLDVTNLSPGVYLLEVQGVDIVRVKRVVIQ